MITENKKERFARIANDPETMDTICDHLTNGGNLLDLCETWKVRYSDVIFFVNGSPERKKRLDAALDARQEWAVQRVLSELNALAFVDIRKIFDENHELLPVDNWPDDVAKSIAGIEVSEIFDHENGKKIKVGQLKKVKIYDKLKSLELLGKDLGRFVSKHEVTGRLTLEDLVTGSNKND